MMLMMTYFTTIRLRVDRDTMPERDYRRLRQILHRDHRVIRKILGIIHANADKVLTGIRVNKVKLHHMLYATTARPVVKHDIKKMFPRSHPNSLLECKSKAETLYNFYMRQKVRGQHDLLRMKKLTGADIFYPRFEVDIEGSSIAIIDAMDSQLAVSLGDKTRTTHPRLRVAIKLYPTAVTTLKKGRIKSLVFSEDDGQLWANIAVQLVSSKYRETHKSQESYISQKSLESHESHNLSVAILGLDMGISTMITSSLLTTSGVAEWKQWDDKAKRKKVSRLREVRKSLRKQAGRQDIRKLIARLEYHTKHLPYTYPGYRQVGKNLAVLLRQHKNSGDWSALEEHKDLLQQLVRQLQASNPNTRTKVRRQVRRIVKTQVKTQDKSKDRTKNRSNDRSNDRSKDRRILKKFRWVIRDLCWYISHQPQGADNIYRRLRKNRGSISRLKEDIDKQVVNQLSSYVADLSRKYNLHIVVGDLRGIRYRYHQSLALRRLVYQWSYGRVFTQLQHQFNKLGLGHRFERVDESYTSIRCHRCGKRGLRPRQSRFVCSNQLCHWQGHADLNGATNIALRGINTFDIRQKFDDCRISQWLVCHT